MSQRAPTPKQSGTKHIGPYKEQEPFLWSDKRYLGFIAGVGSGKTHIGMGRTVRNVEEWNAGYMGAIVAPASRMIKDTILPLMREYDLIGEGGAWTYESSYAEEPGIHAPNGSRVLILSADNQRTIERLKGLNLAWAWIDERAEVLERAQQILQQRLRVGNYRNLYETTTPKGKDSVYDFYVGDVDATKKSHGRATLYETDNRRAIVGVPTDANPFTPEDYKRAMEQDMPDEIRAQEVQGEFIEIGKGILTMDMLETEPVSIIDERGPNYWNWHVYVDLGIETNAKKAERNDTDYWSLAVVAEHPRQPQAYLAEVRRRRGQAPSAAAEWIKECLSWVPTRAVRYESVQAQSWFESHLQDAGLEPIPHTPRANKEDRIIGLSVPFSNGQVKLLDWSENPRKDVDWGEFRSEWVGFPSGKMDQLDSVAGALDNVNFGANIIGDGLDLYGRDR